MMGRTHKIGGAVMGFAILNAFMITQIANINPIFAGIPFLAANILGALICDIDSVKSTISRPLWIIAIPIFLLQKILNFLLRKSKSKLAKNIKSTVNHRGFAHWPILYLFGICVITIFAILTNQSDFVTNDSVGTIMTKFYPIIRTVIISFLYGLCTGALSHILLDAFNPSGVPLLAPLSFRRISFGSINTGRDSKSEMIFRGFLKVILVILVIGFLGIVLSNLKLIQ